MTVRRRLLAGALISLLASSTLLAPAALAQGTGRIERCAVQSPASGAVIVAYTRSTQDAVDIAAAQCSYLISTNNFVAVTNHVGLTNNPDFARVCMIEFSSDNSLDVFRSVYRPASEAFAEGACNAADNGSALVTYD